MIIQKTKVLFPELSYAITGICFEIHNKLGRFAREKYYGDYLAMMLDEKKIKYYREYKHTETGDIIDFLIEDKIIIELKAKKIILRDDYYQAQRYLKAFNKDLALLINFRNRYLKPIRVIRIENWKPPS